MEGCHGYITEEENITKREIYSHEQYMQLILDSGLPLSHDYGLRSVDEDPRMLAFFDSLIQRVNAGWLSDDSSDEEAPVDAMGEFLLHLASQIGDDDDDDDVSQNAPNVLDSFRLFRSNRRLLTEESDHSEEQVTRSALSRRLRRLLSSESLLARTAVHSESHAEGDPGIRSRELIAQDAVATSGDQSPRISFSSSQPESFSRRENSTAEVTSDTEGFLNGSSVSKREMEGDDDRRSCDGSSSCAALEGQQSYDARRSTCSSNVDDDQERASGLISEVASLHSASNEEGYDCCLQGDKTEPRQLCNSNETCPKLGSCHKNSLENLPSTHLCEKTKYVAKCNDVKQEIIDRTNSSNCSSFPTVDSIDYDRIAETSFSGENCTSSGYYTSERTCDDDLHNSRECKRKKFDDTFPCSKGNIIDESHSTAFRVNKTKQDPTCSSTMVNAFASVCVADAGNCSSTIPTSSLRENEASDERDSETRIRRRSGYKKRNYRKASSS